MFFVLELICSNEDNLHIVSCLRLKVGTGKPWPCRVMYVAAWENL